MKYLSITVFVLGLVHQSIQTAGQCTAGNTASFTFEDAPNAKCQKIVKDQIKIELGASISYLAMSAHFTGDSNFRPGVAKFFLDSAAEERGHAKKMIEYMLQRGWEITSDVVTELSAKKVSWSNVETALKDALDLEKEVTNNIRKIIIECEGSPPNDKCVVSPNNKCEASPNDYHTVDYFTGEFLKEQHESLRELSGHYATLIRMKGVYGVLTEIIFDKTFA